MTLLFPDTKVCLPWNPMGFTFSQEFCVRIWRSDSKCRELPGVQSVPWLVQPGCHLLSGTSKVPVAELTVTFELCHHREIPSPNFSPAHFDFWTVSSERSRPQIFPQLVLTFELCHWAGDPQFLVLSSGLCRCLRRSCRVWVLVLVSVRPFPPGAVPLAWPCRPAHRPALPASALVFHSLPDLHFREAVHH